MIRSLVSLSVETALEESHRYWLNEVFEKGFVGYGNFSDAQLAREMQLRGLTAPVDAPDEDPIDDDDALDGLGSDFSDFAVQRGGLD